MRHFFYPKTSQAVFLVFLCFSLQIIAGIIFTIPALVGLSQEYMVPWVFTISTLVTGITSSFGYYKSKNSLRPLFRTPQDKTSVLLSLLVFMGTYSVVLIVAQVLSQYVPSLPEEEKLFEVGMNSWLGVLSIVIIGPVLEEILFRGVILRGLILNYSIAKSIVISSILFGALHLDPVQSVTATISGLMLAWVFVKTGSLWVSILIHVLNNGVTTIISRAFAGYETLKINLLWFLIPGILVGIAAALLLSRKPDGVGYLLRFRDSTLEKIYADAVSKYEGNEGFEYVRKHSGYGIASFVISMVTGMIEFNIFILLAAFERIMEDSFINTVLVLIMMGGALLLPVGLGLGIAGVMQKNRMKIFSILGIVFNSLILFAFAIVIILGSVLPL